MVKNQRDPSAPPGRGAAGGSWSRPLLAAVAGAAAVGLVLSFGSLTKPEATTNAAVEPAAQSLAVAAPKVAAAAPQPKAAAAPRQELTNDAAAPAGTTLATGKGSTAVSGKSAAKQGEVAPQASKSIMIMNFAFSPATLTIAPGDTVTWTNMDSAPHNVVVTAGPEKFTSPTLENGETFTFTFTKAGTYDYYCSIHPNMKASVTVTGGAEPDPDPTPTPTPTPEPDDCEALAKTVEAFLQHVYAAHLETSPFDQVGDILDVDQYVLAHTVLIENMLKPQLSALSSGGSAALTVFLQHVYAAHLERSPFEQVADITDIDQYVLTHTVMVEDMVKPLLNAELGSC